MKEAMLNPGSKDQARDKWWGGSSSRHFLAALRAVYPASLAACRASPSMLLNKRRTPFGPEAETYEESS
jgi:hypothetical protein